MRCFPIKVIFVNTLLALTGKITQILYINFIFLLFYFCLFIFCGSGLAKLHILHLDQPKLYNVLGCSIICIMTGHTIT